MIIEIPPDWVEDIFDLRWLSSTNRNIRNQLEDVIKFAEERGKGILIEVEEEDAT